MHMSQMLVKLPKDPMRNNTVAVVPPELSNRVIALLSDDLLKRVDDWRYANRVHSRGEAIRQLIERGLGQEKPKPRGEPKK